MPSKSKKQAKTMSAACKSPEFRKKVDIPKKVACDFHSADKGKYHKEDIEMNEELDRIKKLAGMTPKEEVAEKVELTASDDHTPKDAKASDVSQAMNMARLKKTVEDRDADDTDFTGLFTGVARGEISLDNKGKIAENAFGIIKELDEAVGIIRQKKVEEGNYNFHKGGMIFGKNGKSDEEIDSYSYEPKSKNKKDTSDMSGYAAVNKKKGVAEEVEGMDEMASDEKKAGRRAAGSYGRPGSKEQKRAASKSSRKEGKRKGKEEIDEYGMAHSIDDGMTPEYAAKKAAEMQAMADRVAREGGSVSHEYHDKIADLRAIADDMVHEDMVGDMMGHDDYMDAPTTSCPHCGTSNSYDMESETCSACGAGTAPDMAAMYGDDNHMFEKDSLSRIMVEMIFAEMKKGKNAKEISEELSFGYDGVRNIVEVLKKKVSEGYRVGQPIDRERYTDIPDLEGPFMMRSGKVLYYDPKEGKYYDRDSDIYLSYDEYKAHDSNTPPGWTEAEIQEELPGYDAWKTASPYDNEPSESDIERAHEMGGDYGMSYLHDDMMAQAAVAELKNPDTDPEDRKGLWADLISDVAGTIVNILENEGIMILSDDEVNALALATVKKHMMQHVK